MDLRGSSWTRASGSRVSAIPPAPILGCSLKRAVEVAAGMGLVKALALATRARREITLYCDPRKKRGEEVRLCCQAILRQDPFGVKPAAGLEAEIDLPF